MKLQRVLFYGFFLAAVKAQYSSICPDRDGEVEEINPGYFVKYKCGWIGPHGGPTIPNVNTAQACAQLCQDKPNCTGSSWQSVQSKCVLSGNQNNVARSNVLWMEVAQDPFPEDEPEVNPFPDDEVDCATELGTCQEQNTACQEQNTACQQQRATCQQQRANCLQQKDAWTKKQNALSKCPSQHEKNIKSGGITYKVHCFKRSKGFTSYKTTDHGFEDCMYTCASDSKCKAIHYLIDSSSPCKMLATVDHTKEPDHSSSPQIALIPVTPK